MQFELQVYCTNSASYPAVAFLSHYIPDETITSVVVASCLSRPLT